MNLKPNLWTLLFLITAGALLYVLSDQGKGDNTKDDSYQIFEILKSSSIHKDSFRNRYDNYKNRYLPVVNNSALNLKDSVGLDTLGIKAYTLKEDELEQMYDHYNSAKLTTGKPPVYVYPVIRDSAGIHELDLVFLIMDHNGNKKGFFDFTKPCPPICGSGNNQIPYTNY